MMNPSKKKPRVSWPRLADQHNEQLFNALPEPIRRVLEADPLGPPPVSWSDVEPYLKSARAVAVIVDKRYYSPAAAGFLRRVSRWFA
jgi:hypothetical protein